MLILKKEVDWSLLNDGFSVPHEYVEFFLQGLDKPLARSESRDIYFVLNGNLYIAKIVHINYQIKKRANSELYQIKYSRTGGLSKELQRVFRSSYEFIKSEREERGKSGGKRIKLPDSGKEYLSIYSGLKNDCFILGVNDDGIPNAEITAVVSNTSNAIENKNVKLNKEQLNNIKETNTNSKVIKEYTFDRSRKARSDSDSPEKYTDVDKSTGELRSMSVLEENLLSCIKTILMQRNEDKAVAEFLKLYRCIYNTEPKAKTVLSEMKKSSDFSAWACTIPDSITTEKLINSLENAIETTKKRVGFALEVRNDSENLSNLVIESQRKIAKLRGWLEELKKL